jgi:hypothetical protein
MKALIATVLLTVSIVNAQEFIECGTDDSLIQSGILLNINSVDTISGIVVFALFPEDTVALGFDTLYTRLTQFGDTAGYGPGEIMNRSSFGKHILNLDVNPGL